jgi:hypothetical protein
MPIPEPTRQLLTELRTVARRLDAQYWDIEALVVRQAIQRLEDLATIVEEMAPGFDVGADLEGP